MTLIDRLREAALECGMSGRITSQRDIHLAADALERCLDLLKRHGKQGIGRVCISCGSSETGLEPCSSACKLAAAIKLIEGGE